MDDKGPNGFAEELSVHALHRDRRVPPMKPEVGADAVVQLPHLKAAVERISTARPRVWFAEHSLSAAQGHAHIPKGSGQR